MAKPAITIKFKLYGGLNLTKRVSDLLFSTAVKTQNKWRDNLETGNGALGSHGRPYVDEGEAKNDVVFLPQTEGALSYTIGGDVVQLYIAEYGRVPTPGNLPPFTPIAEWAERKGITKKGDKYFYQIINKIRTNIAEYGLAGFAPGLGAAIEINREVEKELLIFIDDAIVDSGMKKV